MLFRSAIAGDLPPPGTPVLRDGAEVGMLRSGRDGMALATLRLDALAAPLTCAGFAVEPRPPAWLQWQKPTS